MGVFKTLGTVFCLVLVGSQLSFAAGFGFNEWSARGSALGGAMVGRADDPSAIVTNPAGITQLDGLQVLTGFVAIHPEVDVRTTNQWSSSDKDALWIPPHFYATWKVNDRYSIGLGAFSRFGLGAIFDEDWPGRYNSYEAIMESISINPNVAVKVTDKLSAAFGVEAMHMRLSQKKKVNVLGPDFDANLESDGMGYGFNMALHYQPCQYAKLGLSYRSPVEMKLNGDADFTGVPEPQKSMGFFPDTAASGSVTLPDSFFFGVALYPVEKLSVEVGAVYTLWSKYDKLTVNYGELLNPFDPTSDQLTTPKNWEDVWRFHAGLEYAAMDWLDLRVGYVFDQSPIQDDTIDYMVPANDRHVFSGGLGFHGDNWVVDVMYYYLKIMDRDIDARLAEGVLDGEIDNADAHTIGLSVGYKF